MTLSNDEREAIVAYRIQKAWKMLKEAEGNVEMGFWNTAVNRLYYSCYHMVNALLIKYRYVAQTHAGVIRLLGMHFVATGLLSKEWSRFYFKLFEMRQTGDYDDFYDLVEEDVKSLVQPTREFMKEIEKLLEEEAERQ